jgi:epoxide hydrolase-like predicted phosphatase
MTEHFKAQKKFSLAMIKAIVFDWGGVLIENPAYGLLKYFGTHLHIPENTLNTIYRKYEESFQKGQMTEQSLWKNILSEVNTNLPPPSSLWETAFKNVYTEKKEVFQLVSLLKQNRYLTGFLSNTEPPAMRFFQKQLYDMFDVTVFSCAEGTRKPEKEIYLILLTKLQVKAQETVFIDDRSDFVQGAENVGIHGILFHDLDQVRRELSALSVKVA